MIWLAGAVLLFTIAMSLEAIIGSARVTRLASLPKRGPTGAPKVSIVVAARDEVATIEAGVRSMLAQHYPSFEIVVVDDRSTDGTSALLDAMAAVDRRLRVVHVTELPGGWLGKNHALQRGAEVALGEWILFTDADIHLDPGVIDRAIGYCERNGVDHLTASPELILPGFLLRGFAVHFLYSFLAFAKPWKAKDPKSRFFVGVGAFNLVRQSAYRAVGGHERIRLRPDDDMKLAKILKRGGFRQDALDGTGMIKVEWYHSLGQMIRGFEKNMFSGVEYSVVISVLGGVVQLLGGVFPLVAIGFVTGATQVLLALQIGVTVVTFGLLARTSRTTPLVALIYPVVVLLFVYILWRTMVLNLVQGGLRWRGTFYSLRELKANRV